MTFIDVSALRYVLPDGRVLLDDVSFRVGEGQKVALVGANGVGKTTLLRIVAGDHKPDSGNVATGGRLGVMRQFIGSVRDASTVRDFLLHLSPIPIQEAATTLSEAEGGDGMRYAAALATWGDAGGYDAEVLWDTCTVAAIGRPFEEIATRPVRTLSGGEQKRLALEALLRGDCPVLLLDEPDNYLDIAGKEWMESALQNSPKTVLFVSHDREVLARAAGAIVTVEGHGAWVHGGGFGSYHDARQARLDRLEELHRRRQEDRARLVAAIHEFRQRAQTSDKFASRLQAAETKLRRFDGQKGPAERPRDQQINIRLGGGRTGVRALTIEKLALEGLTEPFSTEVLFGERVGVIGPNGSGKSHFLHLLAGESIGHDGSFRLGARVVPGYFAQTHDTPALHGRTPVEALWREGHDRAAAMGRLRRYELHGAADQPFDTLSGGQQARLQILLLEVRGATMLLLDEPTDNLDLASAEALEDALSTYVGTVVAVTHDRWFMRSFDRFLVFGDDGHVAEA